ncbi:phage tail tube protein [uncultured Duncaniella sp.]|jgi:hypothetical protein|uniref:phage tail tube protein n=1 Tax=uncultured Duncaniella sp. TaxID=2768039 RepID=UPI0026E93864|nr:phage tail tube protein [uncultured Duncaniella sp.]
MEGYINGSDMLLAVFDKAIGHCTEHSVTYDTTTKERAVKAPEIQGMSSSLFKETSITGLSITISFKGLQVYDETELDAETLKALWREAKPVTAECFRRPQNGVTDGNRSPYLKAQFVITKLSESATAEDDASFDGELKMTGAPETWTPKIPA